MSISAKINPGFFLIFLPFAIEKNAYLLENRGLKSIEEVRMKLYYKHSTRCPISAGAKIEVDSFLKQNPDSIDFELIDVLSDRARSEEIAEKFGIEHESPQLILTDDSDNVLWHVSHRRIKKDRIIAAVEENR
jgi:bacillithiol system protein YtxJ